MSRSTKIATCCYCGTRAALVLDHARHELTCASCGAPLHDLKRLPQDHPGQRDLVKPSAVRPAPTRPKKSKKHKYHKSRSKPGKRRKGLMVYLMKEAFDVIEDILD
ncbi:hypothetical protein [uncultured Roseobacter sp.]|uniref:hypothetical protein n=1 Tax=uncultured Roseobacter sp. TaxID=114847 RepID=UPI002630E710|nr:hypothetical protein [uncultured Roseobacter sp.]